MSFFHKQPRIESKKLRDSAREQNCTLQVPGVCNHNPETTILAHLPDESHGGSRKSDDFSACFACSDCHDWADGRTKDEWSATDRQWMMRRAMVRTWRHWIRNGLVKIV
tara:strand:+ start:1297 stop:1623 length:327 start_codon:yes stop_codon:yes gene_type:complete